MTYQLHIGNNAEVLKQYPDSHFDAIITDPPYGIEFLGKDWDSHTGTVETWQQCLRVLKPGGHLLAFSAARTYHHLATNIESVGFEIRDQLMWIYSSGFPKAQDIGKSIQRRLGVKEIEGYADTTKNAGFGQTDHARVRAGVEWSTTETQVAKVRCTDPQAKQWAGWKTALKPGHEPILMARKPFKGSTIDNVLQHGVGALNIDVSRIPFDGPDTRSGGADGLSRLEFGEREPIKYKDQKKVIRAGRDPRNRLKDLESQTTPADHNHEETPVYEANPQGRYPSNVLGEIADYQKYFYCPKVSRRERHTGFDNTTVGNNHPTVKPVALMRYLIQLVTPANSRVLDPFMGSGSTGMAAVELGHQFVGIDLDANYVAIADRRIQGWCAKNPIETKTKTETKSQSTFNKLFD